MKGKELSWGFEELEGSIREGRAPVIWWGEEVILPAIMGKMLKLVTMETAQVKKERVMIEGLEGESCHLKLVGLRNERQLLYDFTMSKDGSILDARVTAWNPPAAVAVA